jgi:hypothetical protein
MVLHGTGFDASGNALGNYGVDGSWTVSGSQYGSSAYVVMPGDPDWFPDWDQPPFGSPNNASNGWLGSSWINNNDQYNNGGPPPYTYSMSFDLTGFQLNNNLILSGKLGIDDGGYMCLNGNGFGAGYTWFWNAPYFSIDYSTHPTWFNPGINTITIIITVTDSHLEGVRFEGTVTGDPIPEPGTLVLLGCGPVGLLCYAWRKRR